MSNFINWWIIVIVLVNIAGCYWLIRWTMKARPDEAATGDVTGHVWDGLEEYNNPLPRWWLWLFYITMVFGLVYLAIFPGLGKFQGLGGWSSGIQYDKEMAQADAKYGPIFANYAKIDVETLAKDAEAMEAGYRLYNSYCSQCHGSDARGAKGFPNLADNDWIWGGKPAQISHSIVIGRGVDAEGNALAGRMPAWQAVLGDQGVEEVTNYVLSLSGREVDAASAEAGKAKFVNCIACHGADGKGNQILGGPNLTDNIWLYGGTKASIKDVIVNGRSGVMPRHKEFLGEDKIHLLTAYVYSLSN